MRRSSARKACLPVAAVVDVVAASGDDPYLVAEYLYHDDHFIVLRRPSAVMFLASGFCFFNFAVAAFAIMIPWRRCATCWANRPSRQQDRCPGNHSGSPCP